MLPSPPINTAEWNDSRIVLPEMQSREQGWEVPKNDSAFVKSIFSSVAMKTKTTIKRPGLLPGHVEILCIMSAN
jgi:hypothetical protein